MNISILGFFYLCICAFIWAGFIAAFCKWSLCVVLQPVWCSVYSHQKQNPPPACHRPGHRECTLYSHTQEDPQVPPAFCESNPIIVSLFVIEHIEFLYKRDDKELVPFLLVCSPLVVSVENVETMRWVESDSTKNILVVLCVCVFSRCVKCQSQLSWSKLLGNWASVHTTTLLSFTRTRPSSKRSTSLWRDECLLCRWWMSLVRAQTSLLTRKISWI